MNPDDLIRIARYLASTGTGVGTGRPSQADLRRAVSTTYYALFHALAQCCANTLIGAASHQSQQPWRQTYRALEHHHAKNRCKSPEIDRFPQEIQTFAASFVALQNRRHTADYDPYPNQSSTSFYRHDVLQLITEAEQAINSLNSAYPLDRHAFAAYVLFPLPKPVTAAPRAGRRQMFIPTNQPLQRRNK